MEAVNNQHEVPEDEVYYKQGFILNLIFMAHLNHSHNLNHPGPRRLLSDYRQGLIGPNGTYVCCQIHRCQHTVCCIVMDRLSGSTLTVMTTWKAPFQVYMRCLKVYSSISSGALFPQPWLGKQCSIPCAFIYMTHGKTKQSCVRWHSVLDHSLATTYLKDSGSGPLNIM